MTHSQSKSTDHEFIIFFLINIFREVLNIINLRNTLICQNISVREVIAKILCNYTCQLKEERYNQFYIMLLLLLSFACLLNTCIVFLSN